MGAFDVSATDTTSSRRLELNGAQEDEDYTNPDDDVGTTPAYLAYAMLHEVFTVHQVAGGQKPQNYQKLVCDVCMYVCMYAYRCNFYAWT